MKLNRLKAVSVLLLVIAGAVVILRAGTRWLRNLAEPVPINVMKGTTEWSAPPGSVGTTVAGAAEPPLARAEASTVLQNPVPSTPESVERGKQIFNTYCVLCHGAEGHGDGPVGQKLVFSPPDLPNNVGRFADGYLYATIRNGGPVMPPQGYRIAPVDRWHVVNYLRSIQK